ncbi:MAG: NAD(P)(+) transhydrogenase (Re/Si-specific) subunit beta [Gemmatimonadales bacterium]|nr:MAG: NAD(P)(+) transhydrogenase (Re/Si-specific) subunit beta [Gemmatimonadales bacterium]
MPPFAQDLVYIASAVLFVWGLKRLGHPETARSGNGLAALGMLLAAAVTLLDRGVVSWTVLLVALVAGTLVGTLLARSIRMTAMPQLVGTFNALGGGASALLAAAELVASGPNGPSTGVGLAIALGILVGSVTVTGSVVAVGKLQGFMPSRPVTWPLQRSASALLAVTLAGTAIALALLPEVGPLAPALAAGALLLGLALVLPIGGADMPVVISLLNAYSGLAASAAGFAIGNPLLVLAGALVGAAGLILTHHMCRGMNRSLANVAFGAFGAGDGTPGPAESDAPVRRTTAEEAALLLGYASSVIIVPGYGLAAAQAQHEARKLMDVLVDRGITVNFAIHPVAGRMPGHMNVLLAEADVPYDRLLDLEDANARMPRTDVVVVVGANDVVNPSARDPESTIAGMPILEVDRAANTLVVKRSLSPGFAGIPNPLFHLESTLMLLDDAGAALSALAREVREL